jgi:hypothetical protein
MPELQYILPISDFVQWSSLRVTKGGIRRFDD